MDEEEDDDGGAVDVAVAANDGDGGVDGEHGVHAVVADEDAATLLTILVTAAADAVAGLDEQLENQQLYSWTSQMDNQRLHRRRSES